MTTHASGSHPSHDTLAAFRRAATGQFELLGTLGQGAMGAVYHARDRALGREVALKVLLRVGPRQVARFEREAQLTARLEHPGIVRVHGAGVFAGVPYIAYEMVTGHTLAEALPTLERQARVELVRDAARALGYAHGLGVVHRDVKPQNILVDVDGRLRVADFGLATAQDVERLTQTHARLGTLEYMSPEQVSVSEEAGPQSDVWALGVILYEALCGRRPFAGLNAHELMVAITEARFEPPRVFAPDVPRELERVCLRAMTRRRDARYPHGEALAADLDRALAGGGGSPRAARRWALAGALLVVAALGALATWAARDAGPERAEAQPVEAGPLPVDPPGVGPDASIPDAVAPVGTPTLSVAPTGRAFVPGLAAGPLRHLAAQDALVLAVEDLTANPVARGLEHHRRRDSVLRIYDARTLEPLRAVRIHPPGQTVLSVAPGVAATSGPDGVVKLWTLPDLRLLRELDLAGAVATALAFSPGGDVLLVSDERALALWRVADGARLWTGPDGGCDRLAFLPDGSGFLASAARRGDGQGGRRLERWTRAGERLGSVASLQTWSIAVDAEGSRALTLGWRPPAVMAWRLGDDPPLRGDGDVLLGSKFANNFRLDPAWEHLVIVTGRGDATKLALADGAPIRQLVFSRQLLTAMAAAGDRLYLGGADHMIHPTRFADFARQPLAAPGDHPGALCAISDWITCCDYPLHTLVEAGTQVRERSDRGPQALTALGPSGLLRCVVGAKESIVYATPRRQGAGPASDPQALVLEERPTALAILADPTRFLIAFDDGSVHLGSIGSRVGWRELKAATATAASAKVRAGSKAEPRTLQTLALCATSELGVAAGEEDTIHVWGLDPGRAGFELAGHAPPVTALAAAGERLFAGEVGGGVSVFALDARALTRRLAGPPAGVTALLPLGRGEQLLVAHEDGQVWRWDVAAGRALGVWRAPDLDFVRCFAAPRAGVVELGTQLGRRYELRLE